MAQVLRFPVTLVEPGENAEDFGGALRRHPVSALDTRPLFEPVADLGEGPYVQLWPHRHGTDAMFAAAFKVG